MSKEGKNNERESWSGGRRSESERKAWPNNKQKKEDLKTWEARRLRVRIESKKIEKARAEQEGIKRNEKTEGGWLETLEGRLVFGRKLEESFDLGEEFLGDNC